MKYGSREFWQNNPELLDLVVVFCCFITYGYLYALAAHVIKNKFSIDKAWSEFVEETRAKSKSNTSSTLYFFTTIFCIFFSIFLTPKVYSIIIKYSKLLINFFS